MSTYHPDRWWRLTFAWRGTILPHILSRFLLILAVGILLILLPYAGITIPRLDPLGHSLTGLSLGLLVVFRNNTAYERFWDGRKAWGALVNTSRNLARIASIHTPDRAATMAAYITAYAFALKARLRNGYGSAEAHAQLPAGTLPADLPNTQLTEAIALRLTTCIHAEFAAGHLTPQQTMGMERLVSDLVDQQGTCERIRNTPIPFGHAVHINQLLMVYLLTLPFVLEPTQGPIGLAMVALIAFGLLGIEEAGVEIEEPFGRDHNDLPLDELCHTIKRDCEFLVSSK